LGYRSQSTKTCIFDYYDGAYLSGIARNAQKEHDILIQVSILAFIQADGKLWDTNLGESHWSTAILTACILIKCHYVFNSYSRILLVIYPIYMWMYTFHSMPVILQHS